jgi:type IV pilus assembly protein PilC
MEYAYYGYTNDKRTVKGKISAATELAAMDILSRFGYRIISLKAVIPFMPNFGSFLKGKVKTAELVLFSRQLALLLESGLGIVQSLELLQSQTGDRQLRKVLVQVVADIRGGDPLSLALSRHPHVFSRIYQKMLAVGEQTGNLEQVLRNLATYIEKQSAAMSKLKSALTYPAIVAVVAIIVMIIMVTFVLPPILGMFTALKGEVPITTKLLLAMVNLLQNYGLHMLVVVLAAGCVGYMYSKTPTGHYYRDLIMLKLPIMGRINIISELARCCRSMSLLFKSGLPLPDIMTLASQASGNHVLSKALGEVEQDMLKGEGLSAPMRKRWVFLPLMVEMAKVGEATGTLDATLVTVAENYEVEADARIQTVLSMIEPAMTIAIGLAVGFLALSIFMPLYSSLSLIKVH